MLDDHTELFAFRGLQQSDISRQPAPSHLNRGRRRPRLNLHDAQGLRQAGVDSSVGCIGPHIFSSSPALPLSETILL